MYRIYGDYGALSRAGAEFFAQCGRNAIRDHRLFRVALSGGDTPKRLYEILTREPHPATLTETCTYCGQTVCENCKAVCKSCGRVFCRNHMGMSVCADCAVDAMGDGR